ncbi:MAG: MotA/TolQ/ExbB proton channel family protein [Armatimonadota bacterium]
MGSIAARSALLDYFVRGGSWMWVLLACSIIALAVIIYKLIGLWVASRGASNLVSEVISLMEAGERDQALERTAESSAAIGNVLHSILATTDEENHQAPLEAAEAAGAAEVASLESGLPVLSTIANVAPLIGFLGTVSGMIRAFTAIAEHGLGEPAVVAGGIGEALITTASGLIVAIPCFVAYGFFISRVNNLALGIELAGTRLANLLSEEDADEASIAPPAA